jgi:hypothetical protein
MKKKNEKESRHDLIQNYTQAVLDGKTKLIKFYESIAKAKGIKLPRVK